MSRYYTEQELRNLIGERINKLTVIDVIHIKNKGKHLLCKCDCGNEIAIYPYQFFQKTAKSCGCIQKRTGKIYNVSKLKYPKLYSVWNLMRHRCYDKSNEKYKIYGNRGISVCDAWKNDFLVFYEWAINNGYAHGLTLDRINVNGNYCPENCRWVTAKEQQRNRRNTIIIIYNNEKKSLTEWCEQLNIKPATVRWRLSNGWTPEKALTYPAQKHHKIFNKI